MTLPWPDEEKDILRAVIDASTDAIISTDVEGCIMIFNPAAERVFGRSRQSVEGQNIEILLPERYRDAHQGQRQRFARAHEPSRMMGLGLVKGLRADGVELDLEGIISQVTVQGQQLLLAHLRDVTERVRLDAERQQSRNQLSELTRKLMSQEKTFVKRMVQTLHDQLGQTLAAIRMVHETMVLMQKDRVSHEVHRLDQQLGILINQAIRQVRQVLLDLHPPLLEEQGLAAALDNELRNRALTHPQMQIDLDVKAEVSAMRWPSEVEFSAFMVAREAVENALRHSGATALRVALSGGALQLHLEVTDNGVGLPDVSSPQGHLGIVGMQERANTVGSTLQLEPSEAGGTCVRLNWQPAP